MLLTVLFIILALPVTIFMVQHTRPVQSAVSLIHYTVYEGSLTSGWKAQSWASDINLANTSPVYSGSRSISFTPTRRGAGLYLYTSRAVDTRLGSGSLEQDDSLLIVAVKKEEQTRLVHHHRL